MRSNASFRAFSDAELSFVQGFKTGEVDVKGGATVLSDGHDSAHLFTILDGWAVRVKHLDDGRRQIINFAFPGDFLGLQASLFDRMEHSVEALTDMRLCMFERPRLWELFQSSPSLGFDLTWLASREELILSHHLVNVGRRTARERIAYVILLLFERARVTGLAAEKAFEIPITQEDVADLMGLSVVHTNKVLRQMHHDGLLTWTRSKIIIKNQDALSDIAGPIAESRDVLRPFI